MTKTHLLSIIIFGSLSLITFDVTAHTNQKCKNSAKELSQKCHNLCIESVYNSSQDDPSTLTKFKHCMQGCYPKVLREIKMCVG